MMKSTRLKAGMALLLCLTLGTGALAEQTQVTEITVPNTAIKGVIQIEKTGPVRVGTQTDGSNLYEQAALKGAVFEIHAAEDIIGKDGKQWFKAGDCAATVVTNGAGVDASPLLPLGKYAVQEVQAPDGYVPDSTPVMVTLAAIDAATPVVTATVHSVNEPNEILLIKTDPGGTALPGIPFGLFDADGAQIASGITDSNGLARFRLIPSGTFTVRELMPPNGYCTMQDVTVTVERGVSPEPILCVNIPNHYAFRKTNSDGKGLAGVKFVLADANGHVLRSLTSDADGLVSITDLTPGTYHIRETKTLEGYTLSGEVRKLVIDEKYTVPATVPIWVNYTTIQTGVQQTVTVLMIVGIGLMAGSIVILLMIRKRRR